MGSPRRQSLLVSACLDSAGFSRVYPVYCRSWLASDAYVLGDLFLQVYTSVFFGGSEIGFAFTASHLALFQVTRRKGGTHISPNRSNGYVHPQNKRRLTYSHREQARLLQDRRTRSGATIRHFQAATAPSERFKRLLKSSQAPSNAINPTPASAVITCMTTASWAIALTISANGANSTPRQKISSE